MDKENEHNRLVRDEDLMTEEEIKAWEAYQYWKDLGDDPLELLGKNRGKKKGEIELSGDGLDDGDSL
jgi:hypothetical protein